MMFLSPQVDIPLLYNYVYFTDLFYKSECLWLIFLTQNHCSESGLRCRTAESLSAPAAWLNGLLLVQKQPPTNAFFFLTHE